jgi:hypothetical protein
MSAQSNSYKAVNRQYGHLRKCRCSDKQALNATHICKLEIARRDRIDGSIRKLSNQGRQPTPLSRVPEDRLQQRTMNFDPIRYAGRKRPRHHKEVQDPF